MRVADWIFGLIMLVGAGLIFRQTMTFSAMPGQDYGAKLFPDLIAAGFAICGVFLLISGVRQRAAAFEIDQQARAPGRLFDAGLTISVIILMMLLWDLVGFLILSSGAITVLTWRYWQGRFFQALSVGVTGSLVIDWLFRKMLLVPLPLGPFTTWIW